MGRTAITAAAAVGAVSLALFGGVTAASAAPGDEARATGTFLGGSILNFIDLDAIAEIEGAQAENLGTSPTVVDANTLDLTALSTVNLQVPGGLQVPIDLATLGVVGQYASASPDGSSVGASGAIGEGGVIGTGVTPAPGTAPGPLSVDLTNAVDSLAGAVASDLVAEIAEVSLTLDAVSARAAQAAPDAATGDYTIAGGQLVIGSATLAALTDDITTAVGGLQTDVDDLGVGLNAAVSGVLGVLGGALSADLSVGTDSLTGAVTDLLTGQLTSTSYPGVIVDLDEGTIIVDLDAVQPLNGLAPGTNILGSETVDAIEAAVLALVDGLVDDVIETVVGAVEQLPVTGGVSLAIAPLPAVPVLSVDTTVESLLDGDTSGIELLGVGLTLPGGAAAVVEALATPLQALVTSVAPAIDVVLDPVNDLLFPALDTVVPAVATITVNNRSTSPEGVFSITAALVTLLPGPAETTIALATATVGPNALDDNADVTIVDPEDGDQFVVPGPDDTTTVVVTGAGEPDAEITVEVPGQETQVVTVGEDGTWTATFPDLPVGDYTATATQDVDGSTATVTFEVVEAPDVQIVAPTPDQIFVVPGAEDVTDVTVSGTGYVGSEVDVAVGDDVQTVTVGEDGTWTATFPDLPVGSYTATATQEFDGSTDEVDFTVAETPDVTIETPEDGTAFPVGQPDDGRDVTVSGTGSPGATVSVELDNGDVETDLVDPDGTWSVDFTELPIGEYTAVATQDADGSTASVDFSVVLATPVAIAVPGDGDELFVGEPDATRAVTVSGTGQPGAEVEVEIDGLGIQTATVTDDGAWSVSFPTVPVGEYTAVATQDIDGSTDSVTFSVAAQAADADADGMDADGMDADGIDADGMDADGIDADGIDADGIDADAVDADAVDADGIDADAVDADGVDADAVDADAVDADAVDADGMDADAVDADAVDADGVDADGLDADAVDADGVDADGMDADAVDADAVDADGMDADAVDADGVDADGMDADADADGVDADGMDADADAVDADADADGVDADGADADADTDADGTDADGTDGGVTTDARAEVTQKRIVRSSGATQTVVVSGFQPGETVSGTVTSTGLALTPVIADASGSARLTFAVGAGFPLGSHRVDVRGSVTGDLPSDREDTGFTVAAAAAPSGGGRLPATGSDVNGPLLAGFAATLIAAGAALWTVRRRSTAPREQR